ncbi:hypothetical protein M595_5467 [Lyngbya aestuarii BL J]|uniref:Uncharacterized protein n=1 Tax=Lyngbya aestuarii BL J TaxID=1348334 RepID=U7QBL8_9CYAN|nr:hypothetical protein M595_5467 [Lyngbya aestuarii BL J]
MYQFQEGLKRTANNFQCLLCNISWKEFVVLILLTLMVVRFVAKITLLSKIELPNIVQTHVVHILRQPAQLPESFKLCTRQVSDFVLLSEIHPSIFATPSILQRIGV